MNSFAALEAAFLCVKKYQEDRFLRESSRMTLQAHE